jgi:hypothetical protein
MQVRRLTQVVGSSVVISQVLRRWPGKRNNESSHSQLEGLVGDMHLAWQLPYTFKRPQITKDSLPLVKVVDYQEKN